MTLKQLQNIIEQRKQLEKVFKDAGEVGIIDINGQFFDAIWKAIESITSVLDPEGWIDWYIYENDYGKGRMKAYISGRESIIESTKDLYELMKDMEGTMKEDYTPGQGCQCSAYSGPECGCDVDWTPKEVYELREKLSAVTGERDEAVNNYETAVLREHRMQEQRDRLAEALRELCKTLLKDKPRDITDLLNKAGDALAAVKGGKP
jgi:hypothetical protein